MNKKIKRIIIAIALLAEFGYSQSAGVAYTVIEETTGITNYIGCRCSGKCAVINNCNGGWCGSYYIKW